MAANARARLARGRAKARLVTVRPARGLSPAHRSLVLLALMVAACSGSRGASGDDASGQAVTIAPPSSASASPINPPPAAPAASTAGAPTAGPSTAGPSTGEAPAVSLIVAADGTVTSDGRPVGGDDAISAVLRAAHERDHEVRLVIKADARAQHRRIVQLMDLAKQAGISKVAFGVLSAGP